MPTEQNSTTPICVKNIPGFLMPCPRCGEDADISINLGSLETEDAFSCRECEANWTVAEAYNLVSKWGRLLLWLEQVPPI